MKHDSSLWRNVALAILVVDDDPAVTVLARLHARESGFGEIEGAASAAAGLAAMQAKAYDLILLDLGLPDHPGEGLLREFLEAAGTTPVAVVTSDSRVETAVLCMQEGAFDFVDKPISPARLLSLFAHAAERLRLRRLSGPSGEGGRSIAFSKILTESSLMFSLFRTAERLAPSSLPVLIAGESGTGKELLARAFHDLSGRPGEFIAVNMAGLDGTLFSDMLFGHLKGAFTGAEGVRAGLVKRAERGTLFLDEIGDIGAEIQVKLLRFLQDGEYYPLGADRCEHADCRLILATNVNLTAAVREGTFREDLYYRLTSHVLVVPPLRERREDIPRLVEHFARQAAASLGRESPSIDEAFLAALEGYSFPGNIRELSAIVHGAVAAGAASRPSLAYIREYLTRHAAPSRQAAAVCEEYPFEIDGRFPLLEELEARHIREALRRSGGNQSAAAILLGISQSTISRKLRASPMHDA